jgi:hyperosmotically inducible protein
MRAVPPIHIIVENGRVTLEGAVARRMDSQIAEAQAKSVPGVFSVTNNLKVDEQEK